MILEQNIQLDSVAQNGQSLDRQRDPNAILNECREIHEGIEAIERNLDAIRKLQQRALLDPNSSQQTSTNTELNMLTSETMAMYRSFASRIKSLQRQPECATSRQRRSGRSINQGRQKTKVARGMGMGMVSVVMGNPSVKDDQSLKVERGIVNADRGVGPSIKEVGNSQDWSVSIFPAPVVVGGC